MTETFADHIIAFFKNIRPPQKLPKGVEVLFPQQLPSVLTITEVFYRKFYNDNKPRTILFGINPGRFGSGQTGIGFTSARQLTENCSIEHELKMQSELSAEFIYEVIERFGGPANFYARFFISAISPLGYVKNGLNLNYYDDPVLQQRVTPFIVSCINEQVQWNVNRNKCVCIGGEKNFKFFSGLNAIHHWFDEIIPLPHPRFILQYRRKMKENYLLQYLAALSET